MMRVRSSPEVLEERHLAFVVLGSSALDDRPSPFREEVPELPDPASGREAVPDRAGDVGLGLADRVAEGWRRASPAAMAAENVHPVPWVFGESTRGAVKAVRPARPTAGRPRRP